MKNITISIYVPSEIILDSLATIKRIEETSIDWLHKIEHSLIFETEPKINFVQMQIPISLFTKLLVFKNGK